MSREAIEQARYMLGTCQCDTVDGRLCFTVREVLARAGPMDSNPRCWCQCHTDRTGSSDTGGAE